MLTFHIVNLVLPTQWCMGIFYCSFESPTSSKVPLAQMNQRVEGGEQSIFLGLVTHFSALSWISRSGNIGYRLVEGWLYYET